MKLFALLLSLATLGCAAEVVSMPPDAGMNEADAGGPTPEVDAGMHEADAGVDDAAAAEPDATVTEVDAGRSHDASPPVSCDESRSWLVETSTCSRVRPLTVETTLSTIRSGCELRVQGTASCGSRTSTSNPSYARWEDEGSTSAVMFGWCGLPDPYACVARLDELDRLVLSCTVMETCSITLVEDLSR